MVPCTYKRALLTTPSQLIQAHKTLEKISERLKLWMYSGFYSQMLVDLRLEAQDTSSGSIESTRLASEELLTRHDSITCQSGGINSADDLDLSLPSSKPPPDSHCHAQNDEAKYRDREILEEDFCAENGQTVVQYLSNASREPELCNDSATVFFWPSDIPSPRLSLWRRSVESFDCIDKEDADPLVDMLCDPSSVAIGTPKAENNDQDTQDTGFCIVITPPDDSWETFCYTTDNNRIGFQYFTSLVVSPFYQFTSRLVKYEEQMALYYPLVETVSHYQPAIMPGRTSSGPLVFSLSESQKHLQETKNDRINYCYLVTASQRYQLKVAAFTASLKACLFRMRYTIPGFLENIEPRFRWIDPAEILFESFRHTPQSVIIYTSHRPCSVPHIAIHESPPNDRYVVWNNSPHPQNYCFLAISSPNPLLWEKDNHGTADNYHTDTSFSLCNSYAPATPKDFSSTLEQDLDFLFGEDTHDTQHIYQQYEAELVVRQCSEPRDDDDTTFPLKSEFFIDDEEDGLPPLDDWYIAIANRCMLPEEAEAVAAAAAASLSCH